MWGLAFKPRTDDMREAPSLTVIEELLAAGASIRAHDPEALESARRVFGDRITYHENNYEALTAADALIILTEWTEFRHPNFQRIRTMLKSPVIFDGRNLMIPTSSRRSSSSTTRSAGATGLGRRRRMMRILVTGGAGFIGSHTVDALAARGGHEISIIDDLSAGKREQVNSRAHFYQADLRDAAAVRGVIERERPEVLVHLAAQMDVRRSVADPAFDAQVNLVGFLNLMEAGREHGLRRVVFSSTGGAIYGEQDEFPCGEDHPLRPVSPYGVAKLATEAYLFFYKVQYGIDYAALRYGNVYGPRQDPHGEAGVVAIFCGRMLEGKSVTIYGDGEQTRDYVFVGDVVRANVAAASSNVSGAVNVGTGIETSVNDLYHTLGTVADVTRPPEYRTRRAGEQRRSVISAGARAEEDWNGGRRWS